MVNVTPVKYDAQAKKHEPFANGDKIDPNTIPIDPDGNNLARVTENGILVTFAAPADVQAQYVSSTTGNDANAGTQDAPLRTIRYAVSRLPDYTSGTIYLKAGDTFDVEDGATKGSGTLADLSNRSIVCGQRRITFSCYGDPTRDAIASHPGVNPDGYQYNRPTILFTSYNITDVDAVYAPGFSFGGTIGFYGVNIKHQNTSGRTSGFAYGGPFSTGSGSIDFSGVGFTLSTAPLFYGPASSSARITVSLSQFDTSAGTAFIEAHGYSLSAPYGDTASTTTAYGTTLNYNFNAACGTTASYPGIVILSADARTYQGLTTTNKITQA